MRALLVVNPKATTTSEHSRDILVRALRSEVDLQVEYTRRRGHAAILAGSAARSGIDVVVTLGGDGTVNEVVNGLLTADPAASATERPLLAVVPGGSTNVFARALGLPGDWAEGTYVILNALRQRRTRTINLGRVDDRYFTFCAGLGIDAEVVRRVERARMHGKVSTPWLYLRSITAEYALRTDRRAAPLTLERPDEPDEITLANVIVQNTAPWTYLRGRPIDACPNASFDTGLDVMGMRTLHVAATVRAGAQFLAGAGYPSGERVVQLHDIEAFTVRADRPVALQVDGDYLGERVKVQFSSVPDALRVICAAN
jgi:diacylglycerol kinase family enzyme